MLTWMGQLGRCTLRVIASMSLNWLGISTSVAGREFLYRMAAPPPRLSGLSFLIML